MKLKAKVENLTTSFYVRRCTRLDDIPEESRGLNCVPTHLSSCSLALLVICFVPGVRVRCQRHRPILFHTSMYIFRAQGVVFSF